MNINVVRLSLTGTRLVVAHLCSIPPFSVFLVCRGPKPSHLLQVLQYSPEPRRQDTDFVLALRSDDHPGIFQAFQEMKIFNPFNHLDMSSSRSSDLMKYPKEHTLSSFDEVRPQSIYEILDSIGGSQIHGSVVLYTVLHLRQVCSSVLGLVFLIQSTVRSNQSSINSSHLNQDVDPSKRFGIFHAIPLPAGCGSVNSARYAPTIDSAGFSVFSPGKSSGSSSWSFTIYIVESRQQNPLTRDLVHDKILFFQYVRDGRRLTPDKNTQKNVMILCLLLDRL